MSSQKNQNNSNSLKVNSLVSGFLRKDPNDSSPFRFGIEIQDLFGAAYKHGKAFTRFPRWVVVHYTAVPNASAYQLAKSYANITRAISTHFFCDEKDVYRVVPESFVAWHVGDGKVLQPIKYKRLTNQEIAEYGDRSSWLYRLASLNHLGWLKGR